MAKPQGLTITELAGKTTVTRNALFKKCSRANKKKDSLIYVNGYGWCSITKPGKEYIVYLISADESETMAHEIKNNIKDLIDVVDSLICEECQDTIKELRAKVLS